MSQGFKEDGLQERRPSQFDTNTGLSHDYANNLTILELYMSDLADRPVETKRKLAAFQILKYSQEKPASRYPEAYNDKTRAAIEELDGLAKKLNLSIKQPEINTEEVEDVYNRMIEVIYGTGRQSIYANWTGRNLHKPIPKP